MCYRTTPCTEPDRLLAGAAVFATCLCGAARHRRVFTLWAAQRPLQRAHRGACRRRLVDIRRARQRNIWCGTRQTIPHFEIADLIRRRHRRRIETLAWASIAGAAFERGGEPNPRDLPLGRHPVSSDDRPWRHDAALIGDGSSPAMSPKTNTVAYVAHFHRADAAERRANPTLPLEISKSGALTWSPDGARTLSRVVA